MIKVAFAGVGNCASSLTQCIYYYSQDENRFEGSFPEIIHYDPKDIEIVAAFDIDERKVGKDVATAIFEHPNNTTVFYDKIPQIGVEVMRGPTLDGYPKHMDEFDAKLRFVESSQDPVDVTRILEEKKPDFLINYLPVGSQKATEYYAECCINAGVSFINAIPVLISSEGPFAKMFEQRGLVCVGDDIKSQVGATIIHRTLINLFESRGIRVLNTYQLNTGGNTDFLNMLDRSRLEQKKKSKLQAITSQISRSKNYGIHVGPSDFVAWQRDNKIAFIRIEGLLPGDIPMNIEVRLSVEDSPNSAGIMLDIIRLAKLALDKGLTGYLQEVSAFGCKSPQTQLDEAEIYSKIRKFILA